MAAVMLVSMTLVLAALAAVPAMNSPVFAGGDKDDHDDKCKLPTGEKFPGKRDKCPPGLDKEDKD
jgi:hypothetical protein